MKYFIIAGEASGDLHGSNLIKAIQTIDNQAIFEFWGGDLMEQASKQKANKHISELAIMGFVEVLAKLNTIRKNFTQCKAEIYKSKAEVLILIDYPGFNLKIAPYAKALNIKVFYYISPKVWAWKQSRVAQIKKYVDQLFSILPFEVAFYKRFDYPIQYVGNPLMDAIEAFREQAKSKPQASKKIIALLPGSRIQELRRMLPPMIQTIKHFPDYQFIIAGAPNFTEQHYKNYFKGAAIEIRFGETYQLLSESTAALVTSGTATLETALLNVPQVVCYKAEKVSYQIAKRLVKIKFISLVNLIMDKEVVKELIQNDLNIEQIKKELSAILPGGTKRKEMLSDYEILQQKVGIGGASDRVAQGIMDYMSTQNAYEKS